jgi:catechol 2,3-dioxygenase-like lactoylglutathione lyase family enzyme
MRLLRIDHVSLNAGDRAGSIAFYEDVLDVRAGRLGPPDQPVFLGPPGVQLALFADRAPGLRHIALATDDAGRAAVVERLERRGVAYQPERHSDHDSVYFRDPDGIVLEVMVPRLS